MALALLIVVNVSGVILESVEPIHRHFVVEFDLLEHAATAILATEYGLRLLACGDLRDKRYRDPRRGRLLHGSFFALIDLVSVMPAVIGFFGAADLHVLRGSGDPFRRCCRATPDRDDCKLTDVHA